MSIKLNTFHRLIGRPLNTHNFFIQIPTMSDIELLVSSTSFPSEKLGTKVLYYQGEPTYHPTMPSRGGTWSCTMHEGELAKVYKSASLEFKTNFLQDLGIMNYWSNLDKFDVIVGSKTIDSGIDHRSSETPFSVKMCSCYFVGMEPVQLGAGQATQAWNWQLTFQYDSLDYSSKGFLSRLANKPTLGFVGDGYKGLSSSRNSLPPSIPELQVGDNELKKQLDL